MAQKYAIIVAGGSGLRMGGEIPKQFMLLAGTPILVHTINRFLEIESIHIVLVLPKIHFSNWEDIKDTYFPNALNIEIVEGGATRFQSVRNGLSCIKSNDGLVAIHDAVRPFIQTEKILKAFDAALENGSVVLAVPSKDSIRVKKDIGNAAIARETVLLVQTPQIFRSEIHKTR